MDIEHERTNLQYLAESQLRRVDHLKDRINRSTRELHVHEVVRTLTENKHLSGAMRSLVSSLDVGSATSSDVRAFLAEHGVIIPTEFDMTAQGTEEDCTVVATYHDEAF